MRDEEKKKGALRRLAGTEEAKDVLDLFLTFTGAVYGSLDRRLDIDEAVRKQLYKPVPAHVNWTGCFGGITLFLFMIQVATGILLTLYYRPAPEAAYESVRHITNDVGFGWLVRGIHHWAATVMVATVFIHTLRVFFTGAYKPPRELNWVVGTILLFIVMGFAFTGYLLPWDQLSYWATTVGTEIAGAVPLVGKYLLLVLRGGAEISGETLTRFYAFHVIILPFVALFLMGLHFLMIRRQGISGPL